MNACAIPGCTLHASWSEEDQANVCDLHWIRRYAPAFAELLLTLLEQPVGVSA